MKHSFFKRIPPLRQWTTQQISSRLFYALTAIAIMLFVLFRLVGYDIPYDENPDRNAPLLTGTLIWFMTALVACTLALMAWSMIRSMRTNGGDSTVNRIPAQRIAISVAAATAALMIVCFALADTTSITVNGAAYTDTAWLRTADMFVWTSILMIAAAVGAVIFGATRHIRK